MKYSYGRSMGRQPATVSVISYTLICICDYTGVVLLCAVSRIHCSNWIRWNAGIIRTNSCVQVCAGVCRCVQVCAGVNRCVQMRAGVLQVCDLILYKFKMSLK